MEQSGLPRSFILEVKEIVRDGIATYDQKLDKMEARFIQSLKETEERITSGIKDNFVCKLHCGQKRGKMYTSIIIVGAIGLFALGWKGIDLIKLFI